MSLYKSFHTFSEVSLRSGDREDIQVLGVQLKSGSSGHASTLAVIEAGAPAVWRKCCANLFRGSSCVLIIVSQTHQRDNCVQCVVANLRCFERVSGMNMETESSHDHRLFYQFFISR